MAKKRKLNYVHEPPKKPQSDWGGKQSSAFYRTAPWRKCRAYYFNQNPVCEICKEYGMTTPMDIVDHIVPIKQGGAPFDHENLQSLCDKHHNQKTRNENKN